MSAPVGQGQVVRRDPSDQPFVTQFESLPLSEGVGRGPTPASLRPLPQVPRLGILSASLSTREPLGAFPTHP